MKVEKSLEETKTGSSFFKPDSTVPEKTIKSDVPPLKSSFPDIKALVADS